MTPPPFQKKFIYLTGCGDLDIDIHNHLKNLAYRSVRVFIVLMTTVLVYFAYCDLDGQVDNRLTLWRWKSISNDHTVKEINTESINTLICTLSHSCVIKILKMLQFLQPSGWNNIIMSNLQHRTSHHLIYIILERQSLYQLILAQWSHMTLRNWVIIIGSDNGLPHFWHQANADLLSIWPSGTNLSEIQIKIWTFSFTKIISI